MKREREMGREGVGGREVEREGKTEGRERERERRKKKERERERKRLREKERGWVRIKGERVNRKKVPAFLRFRISLKKNREIPFVRRSCGNRHNALSLRISHGNAALPKNTLSVVRPSGDSLKSEEFFPKPKLERSVHNPLEIDVFHSNSNRGQISWKE